MNKLILFALVFVLGSCHDRDKRVGDNGILLKRIDSLESVVNSAYTPGFGEIMSGIQNHHAKLWFGGVNDNWQLADFEIHEINELIEDLKKFQSSRKEVKLLGMMAPQMMNMKSIIDSKNKKAFEHEFAILTKTCNDCHAKTGYEFINISIPQNNSFSNQKF